MLRLILIYTSNTVMENEVETKTAVFV